MLDAQLVRGGLPSASRPSHAIFTTGPSRFVSAAFKACQRTVDDCAIHLSPSAPYSQMFSKLALNAPGPMGVDVRSPRAGIPYKAAIPGAPVLTRLLRHGAFWTSLECALRECKDRRRAPIISRGASSTCGVSSKLSSLVAVATLRADGTRGCRCGLFL